MEWDTSVTRVEPDSLEVRGHPLPDLIKSHSLSETAHLIVTGRLPVEKELDHLESLALKAAREPSPQLGADDREDVSKALARCLLMDESLVEYQGSEVELTVFTMGRTCAYLGGLNGTMKALASLPDGSGLSDCLAAAILPGGGDTQKARMLEAMAVASVDHGVTPPSAQATILAATVRAPYEVAVAHGVGAITDVHGGAGSAAAEFFTECVEGADGGDLTAAIEKQLREYLDSGKRVKGLGHRVHNQDPRRDALWKLADELGIAGECVSTSKLVSDVFERVKGKPLPINVDGVIGAITADIGLKPETAKIVFIIGRMAGLSAHYFEEINTQKPMRKVDFEAARYVSG